MFALENLYPGPYYAALWFYAASAAILFAYLPIQAVQAARRARGTGETVGSSLGEEAPLAHALGLAARMAILGGVVCNAYVFVQAYRYFGRPPIRTVNETLVYAAGASAILYLVIDAVYRVRLLGGFAMLIPVALLVWNLLAPASGDKEVPPALDSPWFVPHVMVYLAAYGAMAVTFAMAVAFLIVHYVLHKDAWAAVFRRWSHGSACIAFPMLTAGLCMGGFWAKSAWGDFWTWDPKENWALVSWAFYLLYLHIRYVPGWAKARVQWFLALGIVVIGFTYIGVAWLPAASNSLHVFETGP